MRSLIAFSLVVAYAVPVAAAPYHIHLSWQGNTSTTMTVTWRSTAKSGTVQYGSTGAYGKQVSATSSSYKGSYIHVAQITGLKAASTTFYRCGTSGDWSAKYSFRTAPKAGTSFRYAAYGDSRSNDKARASVRAAIQARNPVLSVHTADFVNNGWSQSQWDTWFKTMQPLLAWSPLMGSIGNHEGGASNYYDQFAFPTHSPPKSSIPGEAYYSFDYANTHFIAVSTEHSPKINDHQYQWLRNDLIATAKKPHIKWIVAYGHRPPYSSGSHGSYTSARKAWGHLFESFGVDVTFWGHDHAYERTKPLVQGQVVSRGGVIYIVTGGAGAPLYTVTGAYFTAVDKKMYHFCEINVSGDQMKLEARPPSGAVFDTVILKKPGPKPHWVLEGAADTKVKVIGTGGSELKNLRAAFNGRHLYVSTQGVPASKDHFVFLSHKKPTALATAPWNKGGKVWGYDMMLAMESSSGWSNWQAGAGSQGGGVPMGSVWKYHDQGKDLGTAWLAAGYNDSGWKSGPAQLGYGDGDEKTKLKNPSPNYPSVYFRKKISLSSVPTAADLSVVHDDGVAVWINGKLVFSKYVSKGTNYSAWASSQSSDNQKSSTTITQSGVFKKGTNIVAVMIKQVSKSSSDISFDLSLSPKSGAAGGFLARASNPAGAVMEGIVDIKETFGSVPKSVFLAAAAYGSSDGGGLSEQIPKGNSNGSLDLGEWIEFKLKTTPPPPDGGLDGPKPKDGPQAKDGPKPKDGLKPKTDGKQPVGDGVQPGVDAGDGTGDEAGCSSCRVGTGERSGGLLLLLMLASLLLRRRRSR